MPASFIQSLRLCTAFCFSTLAFSASANCSITHLTSSDKVRKVFKEYNGYQFKNYDVVCSKLRKARAKIVIDGSYGVLVGRSYGWANISVADKTNDYLIVNSYGSNSTWVNDYASDDMAHEQLWGAINSALDTWDRLGKALAELDQVRRTGRGGAGRR